VTFRVVRSLRAAQGNPHVADQVNGCLFFWFIFFGQAKKMNNKKTINFLIYTLLLLRAQKKKQEKGTPLSCPPAADTLCFSMLPERWELGFASNIPAFLFVNICDAQWDRMGF